jgi:hypothetical protein
MGAHNPSDFSPRRGAWHPVLDSSSVSGGNPERASWTLRGQSVRSRPAPRMDVEVMVKTLVRCFVFGVLGLSFGLLTSIAIGLGSAKDLSLDGLVIVLLAVYLNGLVPALITAAFARGRGRCRGNAQASDDLRLVRKWSALRASAINHRIGPVTPSDVRRLPTFN